MEIATWQKVFYIAIMMMSYKTIWMDWTEASGLTKQWSAMSTSQAEQPGKTWVVCEDEDGAFNITIVLGFGKLNPINHRITKSM